MVALTISAQVRAAIDQEEQTERLARQALHFTTERDPRGQGWLVRNPKIPGTVELVSDQGQCSCRYFRVWDRCKHAALVKVRHELEPCDECGGHIAADELTDVGAAHYLCGSCIEAQLDDCDAPCEHPYDY